jgi:plasmid stabilization system protein ParE
MSYTVTWKESASDRLAEIWMSARDRRAVTAAADRLDAALRADPHLHGESRDESTRLVIVPPLAVVYEVLEADRLVHILAVRDTAGHS